MTGQEVLTCQELVELATDYLEEMLPSVQRSRLDAHLLTCDECLHYLEQMRIAISAAGMVPEEEIDPAARAELLLLFRDWKRSEH